MAAGRPGDVTVSPLDVLYEDNHCLAVVKPAGLLTTGDSTGDQTLLDQAKLYVKERYNKPGNVYLGVVQRLDRPVSGIVLFARTSKAAARLAEQFRERTVEKVYFALVDGVPAPVEGTLRHFLLKNEQSNVVSSVTEQSPGAKEAVLDYSLEARHGRLSLLRIEPRTGRSHQIRVQLSSIGCPIVGDTKYGGPRRTPPGMIALHAARLRFSHPTRDETIEFDSPLPDSWLRTFG